MDFVASSNRTSVILQLKDLFEMLHCSSQRGLLSSFFAVFLAEFRILNNLNSPTNMIRQN